MLTFFLYTIAQKRKKESYEWLPAADPVDKASRDHVVQEEEVAIPVPRVVGHFEEALVLVYHGPDLGSVLLHGRVPVKRKRTWYMILVNNIVE